MIQRLFALILAVVFSVSALTGCISQRSTSGGTSSLAGYPLESVSQNGNQRSYVYRAANETVPQVARKFTEQHKPTQSSKEDNQQMFLVYSDELYSIQQDKDKPSDTLIEVSNKEFVQQNYSLSFLQGYFLASILNDLFNFGKSYGGNYRGYTSRDTYKPVIDYRPPTAAEQKSVPPLTKEGVGTITKRSSSADTSAKNKNVTPPADPNKGTITKPPNTSGGSNGSTVGPRSSTILPSKSYSPPLTSRGTGRIRRR